MLENDLLGIVEDVSLITDMEDEVFFDKGSLFFLKGKVLFICYNREVYIHDEFSAGLLAVFTPGFSSNPNNQILSSLLERNTNKTNNMKTELYGSSLKERLNKLSNCIEIDYENIISIEYDKEKSSIGIKLLNSHFDFVGTALTPEFQDFLKEYPNTAPVFDKSDDSNGLFLGLMTPDMIVKEITSENTIFDTKMYIELSKNIKLMDTVYSLLYEVLPDDIYQEALAANYAKLPKEFQECIMHKIERSLKNSKEFCFISIAVLIIMAILTYILFPSNFALLTGGMGLLSLIGVIAFPQVTIALNKFIKRL